MRTTLFLAALMVCAALTIFMFAVLICGCASAADFGPYTIGRCAKYTGSTAFYSLRCADGDTPTAVTCDAVGGAVSCDRDGCAATWDDTTAGGSLCVTQKCERHSL